MPLNSVFGTYTPACKKWQTAECHSGILTIICLQLSVITTVMDLSRIQGGAHQQKVLSILVSWDQPGKS